MIELAPMKRLLIDYRVTPEELCVEHFTLKNLDSIEVIDKSNNKTKSFMLAPLNTSYHKEEEEKIEPNITKENTSKSKNSDTKNEDKSDMESFTRGDIVKELKFLQSPIDIAPLCIDANKEYELQFRNEVDLGVIINPKLQGSINLESSFFKDESKMTHSKNKYSRFTSQKSFVDSLGNFNESILNQMVEIGYTRDNIIHSLRSNELTYCTACYYLLMKNVEDPRKI